MTRYKFFATPGEAFRLGRGICAESDGVHPFGCTAPLCPPEIVSCGTCTPQGRQGCHMKADRGWKRPFDDPIPLPRGRQLVTLDDAILPGGLFMDINLGGASCPHVVREIARSRSTQASRSRHRNRGGRCPAPLSSALFARPQSNRNGLSPSSRPLFERRIRQFERLCSVKPLQGISQRCLASARRFPAGELPTTRAPPVFRRDSRTDRKCP
jgi:hypothetical protein